jgi:hypothetical protein
MVTRRSFLARVGAVLVAGVGAHKLAAPATRRLTLHEQYVQGMMSHVRGLEWYPRLDVLYGVSAPRPSLGCRVMA